MGFLPNDFKSNRELSDIFGDFLDQHFYKPMESLIVEEDPRAANVFFERVYDKERQKRGFDVIMHEGEWTMPIDEKAQFAYMDNPLDTFCLELSYLKHGEPMPGWLLDDTKRTAAYMLCWPKGPADVKGVFTGADMLLVYSNRVKKFLKDWGYDREVLCEREKFMRENRFKGRCHSKCSGFWFTFSPQLVEQSVNVVLKQALLRDLASADMHLDVNLKTGESLITGTWLGQKINTSSVA